MQRKPTSKSTSAAESKPVQSKKIKTTWVSVDFDEIDLTGDDDVPFKSTPSTSSQGMKRAFSSRSSVGASSSQAEKRSKVIGGTTLWVDKHAPKNSSELAVHKKKVSEVEMFLQQCFTAHNCRRASMLLLTGPAGCGKSACVHALAADLGYDVQEWSNPTTSAFIPISERGASDSISLYESQSTLFHEFLTRANRYSCLQISGDVKRRNKVVLVEEFPHTFFKDTVLLHTILRSYSERGRYPLVLIISDSAGGESNERLLLPANVQRDLSIHSISFNPVAPTNLVKVLSKIASEEARAPSNKHLFKAPSKEILDDLVTSSCGDIRAAINALQFSCLKGFSQPTTNLKSKFVSTKPRGRQKASGKDSSDQQNSKRSSSSRDQSSVGSKDTSLFLFRALGKVLYCKRQEADAESIEKQLPAHLQSCYRDPLIETPENIVEKSHLSGDFFTAYLHQNYLDFYSDIDDVVCASEYLSDADYITVNWATRAALVDYSSSVSARGLMYANSARARAGAGGGGRGWRPLNKPQCFQVNRKIRDNSASAKVLFQNYNWASECVHTDLVPYLAITDVPMRDPAQINYLQAVGRFSSNFYRQPVERLAETDVTIETEPCDDLLPSNNKKTAAASADHDPDLEISSQGQNQVANSEASEEVLIEDFDDD